MTTRLNPRNEVPALCIVITYKLSRAHVRAREVSTRVQGKTHSLTRYRNSKKEKKKEEEKKRNYAPSRRRRTCLFEETPHSMLNLKVLTLVN